MPDTHPRVGDRVRGAGYLDALVAGGQVDELAAGAPHVCALQDRDPGRDVDQGEGAQVSAEGGGRSPGGRVFDHATVNMTPYGEIQLNLGRRLNLAATHVAGADAPAPPH